MKPNKKIYYVLSWTWGIIMTLIGACVIGVLKASGKEVKKHGGCYYVEVGKNWGGLGLGMLFICNEGVSEHTKNHEFGHSLQNCLWGPLFPFVICIPSAIRYHYRNYLYIKGTPAKTAYDDIWFEG